MSPPTILIADDDPNIREAMAFVLRKEGFPCLIAEDGKEALEAIRAHRPALVFLDVMMPGMDGYSLCEAVKKNPDYQATRVVFLTAMGQTLDISRGLKAGGDDYFTKPFSPAGVVQKVKALLGLSGQGPKQ